MYFIEIVFLFFFTACAGFAAFLGGRTGRAGAAIFLTATGLSHLAVMQNIGWNGMNSLLLAVDVFCFFALLALAIMSNRYWPIWATGLQLVGVTSHLALWAAPEIVPHAYQAMASFWSVPILLVMVLGTTFDRIWTKQIHGPEGP